VPYIANSFVKKGNFRVVGMVYSRVAA